MRTVRFGYRRRSHVLRAPAVENSRGCKTGIGLEMRKRRDHGPDCWGRHLPARRRCCSAREDAWKKSVYLYFLSQLVSHICAIRGREPYDYKEGQCPAVRVASVNEPSPEWPKIVPLKHRHACFATFPTVEEGTRSYLCMLPLISRALRQRYCDWPLALYVILKDGKVPEWNERENWKGYYRGHRHCRHCF